VPKVDTDEPVVVIPVASVAPLSGEPDGERINTFTLAPRNGSRSLGGSGADRLGDLRERVHGKPLTFVAAGFALGFLLARVLR
jgi:hypothetical protein